jgi:hypothetical protein
MNLVVALFRGPFWVQLLLAAAFVGVGVFAQQQGVQREAELQAILAAPVPETVPIDVLGPKPKGTLLQEVSVTAMVALEHNTELVKKRNGITTDTRMLYMLFAPDAPAGEKKAWGAIIIGKDEVDAFADWAGGQVTGIGAQGPIITITGLRTYDSFESLARQAMDEQGVTEAARFVTIRPYIAGREAVLADEAVNPQSAIRLFFAVAAIFALIGAVKLAMARRGVAGPAATAPQVQAVPAAAAQVPAPPRDPAFAEMLARLAHKRGEAVPEQAAMAAPLQGAARQDAVAPPAASAVASGGARRRLSGGLLLWLGVVALPAGALAAGQAWVLSYVPLLVIGVFYWAVWRAQRAVAEAVGGFFGSLFGRSKAAVAPAGPAPRPAAAQPAPALRTAAPAPRPAIVTARADRYADSPIRSGGFGLSALLPQRKARAAEGPDPYDRLATMVAAERRLEARPRVAPAR